MAKEGTIKIRLTGDSSDAQAAIAEVGESGNKLSSIFEGIGQHIGSTLTEGLGVVTDQIGAALDIGKGKDKLQAQLGLSAEDADKYGKIAGDLYKGAWGESLGEVNDTLALVTQNIGEGNEEWLKKTAATTLDFAGTFGQDTEKITAAVSTMLNTGIAQSSEEAFDILTRGMQTGANKADDLLDTFIEYPTMFRELGLNAADATGILSQGLQAGARDADTVADALKEFAIKSKDGSTIAAAGYEALGLNAQEMTAQMALGGDAAKQGLDTVLDRLRAMKDPVAQDAAAVALFGTKAEDLSDALFAMDVDSAAQGLGEVTGAAQEMSDTLSSNAATTIESYKRQALMGIAEILINQVVPAIQATIGVFQTIGGFISRNKEEFIALAIGIAVSLLPLLIALIPTLIASATALWANVAAGIALAAPFIAVAAVIALVVAGVIYAYQHFGWFKTAVDAVGNALKVAFIWIKDNVLPVLVTIVTHVDDVVGAIINMGAVVWDVITKITGFFAGLATGIANALGGVASALIGPFKSAFNSIASLWNNTVGRLSFTIPGWVPGVGGNGFSMPNIPTFADGGLAFSPMLAVVGDHRSGGAEIISPENKMRAIFREELGKGAGINVDTINVTNGDWGSMNREIDYQWRVNRGR